MEWRAIPAEITDKRGPLTPEDWTVERQHTLASYGILRRVRPDAVIPNAIALQHHERQDGFGYPQALRGTNRISRETHGQGRIILDAEIAAVADVHDALAADRPHRAHEIVGVEDQPGPASQPGLDLPLEPHVQHLVEVDVRQQRRDYPALRRPGLGV